MTRHRPVASAAAGGIPAVIAAAALLLAGFMPIPPLRAEEAASVASQRPAPGLTFAKRVAGDHDPEMDGLFRRGEALFGHAFQPGGHVGEARAGLGPTYNARSCMACHPRAGRGAPPRRQGEPAAGLLVRLSVPGPGGAAEPHPDYGSQLNTRAVAGVPAEGEAYLAWESVDGVFADGTRWQLRRPVLLFLNLTGGPVDETVMRSARVPPVVAGLGLLDEVPELEILSRADPDDADGDGISGRANRVAAAGGGKEVLGRFGWKAGQADLLHQTAIALIEDMGLTTRLYRAQNCPPSQNACRAAVEGGDGAPEIDDASLDALVFYVANLRPPARRARPVRAEQDEIRRGELIFHGAGCPACHAPRLAGADGKAVAAYTDLLLHDMGDGLDDGRPEAGASGREWRTPPLWGLGLIERVNGHLLLLHDGRARGLAEAILWHGGEAERAKEFFRTLPAADRAALLTFLRSL